VVLRLFCDHHLLTNEAHMAWRRTLLAASASATLFGISFIGSASADEATIRRNLAARLPNLPAIDAVTPSVMNGLWEIRLGSELIYSDASGSFVIDGEIIDTRLRLNVTEQRLAQLTAVDFPKLPLKDAVVWKQGTGARRLVVFADPNCGYCKQLERDLNGVRDLTVYVFLVPVLGGDSQEKSRAIWCARERGKAWRGWMLDGAVPPAAAAKCDSSVLERNLALGRKHGVVGTPMLVFEDNHKVPGIMSAADIAKKLDSLPAAAKKGKG
jgi:thiol:disulfide interchange protein DsbC